MHLMETLIWRLLILQIIVHCSVAFLVFTFNGTSASRGSPSFAHLVKDVQLTDNFILCLSVKQARFDDIGFFSVKGNDSKEWASMKFKTFTNSIKMTLTWDKNYHIIGKLQNPKIDYWYHICVRFDSKEKEISVEMNGEMMGRVQQKKDITNIPTNLQMKIGADFWGNQFQGSVTNVQLFKEGNVTNLSASPCENDQRTTPLYQWNPEDWNQVGSDWSLIDVFNGTFCNVSDNYKLAIMSMITFNESLNFCKHKLNDSIIPFEDDYALFRNYLAWHNATTGGRCPNIWTPFSDEQTEGTFLNMNNGSEAQLSFWYKDEPNGKKDENYVVIGVPQAVLFDVPPTWVSCSSCLVSSTLLLQLDGLCGHSLIGEAKIYIVAF